MSARTSSAKGILPKPILKKARVGTELPNSIKKKPTVRAKSHPDSDASKTASNKGKGKQREVVTELKPKLKKKKKATSAVADPSSSTPPLPASFKIVCGSYEKLLYGFEGTVSSEEAAYSFQIAPIFIFPAHVSCIKSVAASPQGGKWLATGSADEIIKVWDLRRRKEIGGLMHHEGTLCFRLCRACLRSLTCLTGSITHLEFPSRSHLLSASEDGTLSLFRARDWAVLRSLKGHKGRVNSVAVHQSCKVALSVGKDRTLRMWDLMRGKGSASTKLGKGVS